MKNRYRKPMLKVGKVITAICSFGFLMAFFSVMEGADMGHLPPLKGFLLACGCVAMTIIFLLCFETLKRLQMGGTDR